MTRRGQRATRRLQKRARYADNVEIDAHALLPIELWAHVLTDEHAGLTPLWRHAARATCRLWRAVLDDAPASLRDIPGPVSALANRTTGMWKPERQLAWGRGRVVCASALAHLIAGQRDTVRWTKRTVRRLRRKIVLSVATPPCASYIALTLAASGAPALIDRALGDVALLRDPPCLDDYYDNVWSEYDDVWGEDGELNDAGDSVKADPADTLSDHDGYGGDHKENNRDGGEDDESDDADGIRYGSVDTLGDCYGGGDHKADSRDGEEAGEDYGRDDGQGGDGALQPQSICYESWWCVSPKRYYSGWAFGRRGHPPTRWTAAVGAAVVRTGDRAAIRHLLHAAPHALTSRLSVMASAVNDDAESLDAIFGLSTPSRSDVCTAFEYAHGPCVVAYLMSALDGTPLHGSCRPAWALHVNDIILSETNRDIFAIETAALDRGHARLLSACYDACDRLYPRDNNTISRICARRSIGGARYLWEQMGRGGPALCSDVLAQLFRGACAQSAGDSARDPDALLSWLCDGPPRYDPTFAPKCDGDVGPRVTLDDIMRDFVCHEDRDRDATTVGPGRLVYTGDSDSFTWLCERWPAEMGRFAPASLAAAMWAVCQSAFDPRHRMSDVERAIAAFEGVHALMSLASARDALVEAVDVWEMLFACERWARDKIHSNDPNVDWADQVRHGIRHAWSRCADDGDPKVAAALDRERAAILYGIDPEARRPWRCQWPGAATWRRWCRARPMPVEQPPINASASEVAFHKWLVARGLAACPVRS